MTWEDKLNEHEKILTELYRAIGNAGHGQIRIMFNEKNKTIEIVPEVSIRSAKEFENYKEVLK